MKQTFKNKKFIILLISSFFIFFLLLLSLVTNTPQAIDYTTYETLLKDNNIKKAQISNDKIILFTSIGKYNILKEGVNINELIKKVPIDTKDENSLLDFELILLLLIFLAIILFARKKKKIQNSQQKAPSYEVENIFTSNNILPSTSNLTFNDIAGIKGVKEELVEIVDFLKKPIKYKKYGITLPKGVLLVGPPGVGKTMVAKAIAGEAGVPFFYQSGSSFVQIYVGMGAKRVRELFSKAKSFAPSIVFIDEIDAVGKARGGMRNDEREATLNQLLTEIDGFEDSSGVMVIAATNKIDMMDEALLRSGRFDRRIFLPLPDLQDRISILNIYLKNKPSKVDVEQIAKFTVGFSGAALSTLVNEAAINALRKNSNEISIDDFLAVRDKVILGKKKVLSFNENEKDIQATYQAAKALCAFWHDVEFDKISILGGGIEDVDREIESKTQIISKIKTHLAGIAACNIAYHESFSNAKEDINKARELAKMMIEQYGMGEFLVPSSQDTNILLQNTFDETILFLQGMQESLTKIKTKLLENESISKEQLRDILNETF